MSPKNRLTRALRHAVSRMKKTWAIHVHLIHSSLAYEALVIALTELILAQRINLHRLITTLVWAVTSRWPRLLDN